MSMNLAFRTRKYHYVEFPFQTPTDLSYKVLNTKTTKARLEHIENYLKETFLDQETIQNLLEQTKSMFEDPDLILDIV
jgi:hypothetical protein